jgi:hypothetical protein
MLKLCANLLDNSIFQVGMKNEHEQFSIISGSTSPDSVDFPFLKKSEINAECSSKLYVSLFL